MFYIITATSPQERASLKILRVNFQRNTLHSRGTLDQTQSENNLFLVKNM